MAMTAGMVPHSLLQVKDFGANAADADRLLRACFEKHPVYEGVLSGETYLVLGRKGSGKTAIFSRLIDISDGSTVVTTPLNFSSYPWGYHKLQADADVVTQLRFVSSWRYLILLTLAASIVERYKASPWSDTAAVFDATSALETFLVDTYGSTQPSFTTLFSPSRKLQFSGSLGAKGLAELKIDSIEMAQLPVHFTEVNAAMQKAVLTAADPAVQYYVCFDELDLTFQPEEVEYQQQVAGLLHAARNVFLEARKRNKPIRPVVFLRDDIFAAFDFEDKNKIEDDLLRLHWEDETAPVTLKTMMESRFREVLGTDARPDVAWSDVFDSNELTRGQKPKYDYIRDRTLSRPRDVIKFCNEALASFKQDPNAQDLIQNEHVYAAKGAFSKYFLGEFKDEVHKHFPNYQTALNVLQRLGTETFEPGEFYQVCDSTEQLDQTAAVDLLESLFKFSFVGLRRLGGANAGSGWSWRYIEADALFDAHAKQCRVHPGLKEALKLKEVREKKPVDGERPTAGADLL